MLCLGEDLQCTDVEAREGLPDGDKISTTAVPGLVRKPATSLNQVERVFLGLCSDVFLCAQGKRPESLLF